MPSTSSQGKAIYSNTFLRNPSTFFPFSILFWSRCEETLLPKEWVFENLGFTYGVGADGYFGSGVLCGEL
ncbi:hypothetical protein BABINDRAFT_158865 [Babjeviella inositovora NRRL Y-12698]|uniref:Uncharacterized protein n=1 Tax=Babjeviella inositovora NRRL Y-12698 TaxID=984486 RepID=A0A1E3QX16_9ASCO|nr:uncharacterized protein BABINDRAFT_158865 [Babjeviella inositovora NRRL Y-12698]ODQ82225.1 hypothetical protein BABINDRAFT_158865 [Babjeviella inositovora NRRL Y-12698]